MFGYITPFVSDLKVYEYELVQAYYCGLCRELNKEYKRTSILNYDCMFIYLLEESLKDGKEEDLMYGCRLHPIKKRRAIITDSAAYAADINALMGYAKVLDDAKDGKTWAKLMKPFFIGMYKKAAARRPKIYVDMLEMQNGLNALEQSKSKDTDATADTYAKLFGSVLMDVDVLQSHVLYDLGYAIGRWVYLIDALDDVKEDLKSGNYNVFVEKYDIRGEIPDDIKKKIEFTLFHTLGMAGEALSRLVIKKNENILKNIIYFGLRDRTVNILEGKTDESIRSAGRK